jgi:hypothetical protein
MGVGCPLRNFHGRDSGGFFGTSPDNSIAGSEVLYRDLQQNFDAFFRGSFQS